MRRSWRRGWRRSWPGALAASCLMHASLVGLGAWLLTRVWSAPPHEVELELDTQGDERGLELPRVSAPDREARPGTRRQPPLSKPQVPLGGVRQARPDFERAGKGGSARSELSALNLSDRAVQLRVNRELSTRARESQIQRLRTARERRSLDDRRATPNPMQLSFVATGVGTLLERRPPSLIDPAAGWLLGSEASRPGARLGARHDSSPGLGELEGRQGAAPGAAPSFARGIRDGAGPPTLSARVLVARPAVTRARAAVPANRRASARDSVDSSQQVDDAIRSLVHAGGVGAPPGLGPGGEASASPAPGRDGLVGVGAAAAPAGRGPGSGNPQGRDAGFGWYYERLLKQVAWQRAFPDWAIADGIGGLAVVDLTLDGAGRVSAVRIVRPSGIDEFDRNLVAAIRRDGPYGPLPAQARGRLEVRIAFDATNPVVGRQGSGPGQKISE